MCGLAFQELPDGRQSFYDGGPLADRVDVSTDEVAESVCNYRDQSTNQALLQWREQATSALWALE